MRKPEKARVVAETNPARHTMMLRLAPEVVDRLDAWARQMGGPKAGWTRTELIRAAIGRALRERLGQGKAP